MSPTQRSLKLLRSRGYLCQVVEHFNHFAGLRYDLYGIFDIVAIHPEWFGVLGVQTTAGSATSARIAKIFDNDATPVWLAAQNRIHVHGWNKYKKRVDGKLWRAREISVYFDDSGILSAIEESAV